MSRTDVVAAVPESMSVRVYVTSLVRGTTDVDAGSELLATLNTTTGFVTDDEQLPAHVPLVMVAVFVTVVVSVDATTASKTALAESPLASVVDITSVEPVTSTEHVSPATTVSQVAVPASDTFEGSGSVTVAVPDAEPVFVTTTV